MVLVVVLREEEMGNIVTECKYCGRFRAYPCMNTRDMEDFAEDGDDGCFYQLAKEGGGEKGLQYVINNREARKNG